MGKKGHAATRAAALANRDSSGIAGHLHVQGTNGEGEFRVRDRHFGNVLASGANSGPLLTIVVLLNSTRLDTSIYIKKSRFSDHIMHPRVSNLR